MRRASHTIQQMKAMTLLLVGVLCAAIWWKSGHRRSGETTAGSSEGSPSAPGWIAMPPPPGTDPNRVVIVAPANCPSAEARRAVELARQLEAQQIPCVQTAGVEFTFATEAEVDRLEKVMNAGAPAVFVNRKLKSNPTLDEVVAEYRSIVRR